MQKIVLVAIGLLMCVALSSQKLTVMQANGQEPVAFALIKSLDKNSFVSADENGVADISAFKGAKDMDISALGYKSVMISYDSLRILDFTVYLTESIFDLDEVVVSATRWKQNNNSVASKIISISKEDVQMNNPQTAADLLNLSGKVFIQKSQQGGGSPMIRGFATNRLIYTIDGVRMNNAIFRGGNIQNVINVDAFSVENTEVLFGPKAVIYGSDAIGGVMAFKTLEHTFADQGQMQLSGQALARASSANGELTGHAHVNLGWNKISLISSISHWDFADLRQGAHGPEDYIKDFSIERINGVDSIIRQEDRLLQIPSAYSQTNMLHKLALKPNENWQLQYAFHYSRTSEFGRYDRHNQLINGMPRYAEWNYGPQSWQMHHLNVAHTSNGKLYDQLSIQLAAQAFEESRISRVLNSDTREIRQENVDAYSFNFDFSKELNSRLRLFYGLEYVQNDVLSDGVTENIISGERLDASDRYPQSKWQSAALYLSMENQLNDKQWFQMGLRYNYFSLDADFRQNRVFFPLPFAQSNTQNNALTGSIGWVSRPTDLWVVKAQLSTAFRAPNVDDIGKVFDSEPGNVIVPNPDLEAEYAYNADIGIARIINSRMKVDLSAYYTFLDNALVRRDFQLNGLDSIAYDGELSRVQALQNASQARVFGVQMGLEYKLSRALFLFADLNIQNGEEELEDGEKSPSRHAAPLFGSVRVNYNLKRWQVLMSCRFQGRRDHQDLAFEERAKTEIYALDENGLSYAPAWYSLDLRVAYKPNAAMRVTAAVENITDRRYRPYSSGISAPGINVVAAMSYDF